MSESENKTVFIVDDDEGVRKALGFLLQSAGHAVETFASARDFLERFDTTRRGCVLLDVCMPESSGLDLQRELQARSWDLPVIFITGHGTIPTAVTALRAGALDFIEKPRPKRQPRLHPAPPKRKYSPPPPSWSLNHQRSSSGSCSRSIAAPCAP